MDHRFHPSFPQPHDPDVALWRYMDLFKFRNLAQTGRLFMPNARAFGDQLEGSTPQGEIDRRASWIANAQTDEQRATAKHNHNFYTEMSRKLRALYFVSCWHMNQFENEVMWNAYTRPEDGVAIRVSYTDLQQSLPRWVQMGVVSYVDYEKDEFARHGDTPGHINMYAWIMHKDIQYYAENEVRAVAVPPVTEELGRAEFAADVLPPAREGDFHAYAPKLPMHEIIKEVIVRHGAPEELKASVGALCEEIGLPHPTSSRRARRPVF